MLSSEWADIPKGVMFLEFKEFGFAPYFCGFVEICQLVDFVSKLRLFFGIVFLFYRYIFRDVGKNVIDTRR